MRGVDLLRCVLCVALPVILGTREVIPRLSNFLLLYPLLRMELRVADSYQDLVAEGVDVAIRMGALPDSVFGARKLVTLQRCLVVAPAYLEAPGTPRTPPIFWRMTASSAPAGSAVTFGRSSGRTPSSRWR